MCQLIKIRIFHDIVYVSCLPVSCQAYPSIISKFIEAQTPIPGSLINEMKEYQINSYSGANGTDFWKSAWPNDQMAKG